MPDVEVFKLISYSNDGIMIQNQVRMLDFVLSSDLESDGLGVTISLKVLHS